MTAKERIDELRLKRGWSLNKLAEEIGLTNSAVYAWYREDGYSPSAKSIEQACEAFGITLIEFYSSVDSDEGKEAVLLDAFRKVSQSDKDKVLKIVKIFTEK